MVKFKVLCEKITPMKSEIVVSSKKATKNNSKKSSKKTASNKRRAKLTPMSSEREGNTKPRK